jgi:hypothetical protein
MEAHRATIYKVNKSVAGGGLVVLAILFFGLTLPVIIAGTPVPQEQLLGVVGFWVLGILVTVVPLGFRIEIDDSSVKAYFLNFQIRHLRSANIRSLEYGNLTGWWILPFGKGLKGWERTNRGSKYFSIGENTYGKEAIEHARRVLVK